MGALQLSGYDLNSPRGTPQREFLDMSLSALFLTTASEFVGGVLGISPPRVVESCQWRRFWSHLAKGPQVLISDSSLL